MRGDELRQEELIMLTTLEDRVPAGITNCAPSARLSPRPSSA